MYKIILLSILFTGLSCFGYGQDPQWLNYTSNEYISSSAFEGNEIWLCTSGGIVKLDKITGGKTFYNASNTGLPANYVKNVAIDIYGRKWFGGSSGVTCFDGFNWLNYNNENSPLPTPTNNINALAADSAGYVWIGTDYGGIAKFNGIDWTIYKTSNSGLPSNWVTSIVIDSNGIVWSGTENGLSKFDGVNWTVFTVSNSGLPNNYISSLAISEGNTLWIGTSSGLTKYDGTNWLTYNTSNSGLPSNIIYPISSTANGTLWIGSPNGAIKFDGYNWITYNTTNSCMLSNHVCSILCDDSGSVWIGTNPRGFVSFNGTTWSVCDISNSGLLGNTITSVAIDNTGTKWIGTFISSLTSYSGSIWETYTTSNSNLPSDDINAIIVDQDNNKWFATSAGLAKFDGIDFTTYNVVNSNLPDDDVMCVAIDGSGKKWIGTDNGLAVFDDVNWTVYNTFNSDIPCNSVSSFAVEENGVAWLGLFQYSYGCGLVKFDGTNWSQFNTGNSGIPSNDVLSLAIDANNTKWIGTYSSGLVKFNGTNWTTYNTSNSGLPDNRVEAIAFDQQGIMWIGTDSGLAKFDGTNWTVFNILNSGLSCNTVLSISIDNAGSLWIGTSCGGLVVYNENGFSGADFEFSAGCNNSPIQFTDMSVSNGLDVTSWHWEFGDPASVSYDTSTLQNPTHVFTSHGEYNVCLIVTTSGGLIDTICHVVNVSPTPVANFSFTTGCMNNPIQFTDLSQSNGGEVLVSWTWDFGDTASGSSNTSYIQSPSHLFSEVGTYFVTLICYASNGCSDTVVKLLIVNESPITNAGDDQIISIGTSTMLYGTATGGSGNFSWHWEPGWMLIDPNIQNPTTIDLTTSVIYSATVTDIESQCTTSDQIKITVTGGPLSVFVSADPNPLCLGDAVQLYSLVSGGTGNYIYSWSSNPQGFTSILANPIHEPIQNTIYIVQVYDDLDTIVDSVEVQVGTCPGQAIIPSGPNVVDLAYVTQSEYKTEGTTDATSYEWQVMPTDAGVISGTGLTAILAWNRGSLIDVHVKVRGVNQYGEGDWSSEKITTVYNTVGLTQFENDHIEIFPNPSNGVFKIRSSKVISKMQILDRLDRVIITFENNGTGEFNCDYLANGIYFIRIYNEQNEIILRKLIITH